ncbi:NUDIX hydrolase domain-like protein [Spinellus fusiger]|nr:NUDIX hydrolase domain-like protein [Spinellus fusiger]
MTSTSTFEAAAAGDLHYLKTHKHTLGNKNERGWTSLHFAARYGQLEAAQFIASQANCDLSAINNEGKTASDVAEFWGYDKVAKLLKVKSDVPELQASSSTGHHDTSMSFHYPTNTKNYFAGSPLNRLSWYRSDKPLLRRLARSQHSKFILFSESNPLFSVKNRELHMATYEEIASFIEIADSEKDTEETESLRFKDELLLVFLGIDKREGKGEEGIIYWACNITPRGKYADICTKIIQDYEKNDMKFMPALSNSLSLDQETASIFAQARSLVDWNTRNAFCAGCGRLTRSVEGGHKRTCPAPVGDISCISHQGGVHNFTYPRTDPVIIVCIVHPNEDKILLGRQKSWPAKRFSCIAGFVEAGESIEEAVRREAYEETGVIVDRVAYHSSQPWPFPNSLMFGFIAEAVTTEIRLEDKELESALWFTRAEVIAALHGDKTAPFSSSSSNSIAHRLIKTWALEWNNKGISAKI